jgi:hypothetical protein
MDVLIILRTFAAPDDRFGCGLGSRKLECARHGHRLCDAACIVWIDGWIESKASLVIQNVILLSSMSSAFGGGTQGPRRKRRASDHAT